MRVLVVSKSLCGYVSTKCNIIWRVLNIYDRAIIMIIYILNPWKIFFYDLRFLEVYNNVHQAVKKNDEWCYKLQETLGRRMIFSMD